MYRGRVDQTLNYTGSSLNLIQRNVPQSNVTGPNKSNVVTVTFLINLYEEKNSADIRGEGSVLLPVLPALPLPEKQRLSPAKSFNSSICDENKSPSWPRLQRTFSQKTAFVSWMRELDWQGRHGGNTMIKHRHHHYDVYCHASLGAAVPAFCVNSWRFVFKAELLRSVWITIGGELMNRGCGFYASSPVWMERYIPGLKPSSNRVRVRSGLASCSRLQAYCTSHHYPTGVRDRRHLIDADTSFLQPEKSWLGHL